FDANSWGRITHDVVPGHRGQRAAGHAIHDLIVLIAEPDAADEIARITHEPGVAVSIGRAGFSCGRDAVESGPAARAILDNVIHHLDHVGGDAGWHYLPRLRTIAVEAPHEIGGAGPHFEDRVRRYSFAQIGEGGVGGGVIQHRDFVRAACARRAL